MMNILLKNIFVVFFILANTSIFAIEPEHNVILFDDLAKNPANTGDSASLMINNVICNINPWGNLIKLTVNKRFDGIKSGVGFRFDINDKKNVIPDIKRAYGYDFKYKGGLYFSRMTLMGLFKISYGTFVGVSKYKYSGNNYNEYSEEFYKFLLSLGTKLSYKNQIFGISFDSEHFNDYKKANLNLLIINYRTSFNLIRDVNFNSEVLNLSDLTYRDNYLFLSTGIEYKDNLGIGLVTNSFKSLTYFISFRIVKRIYIDQFYEFYNSLSLYNSNTIMSDPLSMIPTRRLYSHNLGLRIKIKI